MARLPLLVLMLALMSACGSRNRKDISRRDYGAAWPLTVDSGVLACQGGAVTFEANGHTYAVNGTIGAALTRQRVTENRHWLDVDVIWASGAPLWVTDPQTKQRVNVGPRKKSIGPLITDGLRLCTESGG